MKTIAIALFQTLIGFFASLFVVWAMNEYHMFELPQVTRAFAIGGLLFCVPLATMVAGIVIRKVIHE